MGGLPLSWASALAAASSSVNANTECGTTFIATSRDDDDDNPPDDQQGVADGVRDGVAENGDLALRRLGDLSDGGGGDARAGVDAEIDRGVELEHVVAQVDADDHRHGGRDHSRDEQRDPQGLQAGDE